MTDPFIDFNSGHFTVNQNVTCPPALRFSHWCIDILSWAAFSFSLYKTSDEMNG